MTDAPAANRPAPAAADIRDLQARLYREIGISAVAAALRFANQPDPDKVVSTAPRDLPAMLREENQAA